MRNRPPRDARRRLRPIGAALTVTVLVASSLLAGAATEKSVAHAAPRTVVTFTFDDGVADQMTAQQLLRQNGMAGTFYVSSGLIGHPGYMTRANLETLESTGNEIGGHTVNHANLTTLSPEEANRQVCQDRNTLLDWGHDVTSFAYPFVEFTDDTKRIVEDCGYNTARSVGDVWSPGTCDSGCLAAETMPPADVWETRTPDGIDTGWSLAELQSSVRRAEQTGGWVAYNLHHVCDNCGPESISPNTLSQFLRWLRLRQLIGTVVQPVNQVVTGAVKPPVPPAPPAPPGEPGVNTVVNPSMEVPASGDAARCWTGTGYGANAAAYARVSDAHTGSRAGRITISSHTDGDAKYLPTFDLGTCAPSVTVGRRYEMSQWYKSTEAVSFTLYKRDAMGGWSYWTASPKFAPATEWTRAEWLTPYVASGTTGASFGLGLDRVGTLTVDDAGFADAGADATPAPPGVNALRNPSLETGGGDGFPHCWSGAGYGENAPVWSRVEDASDGDWAQRLTFTSLTSGDAKLVPTFDSANCAPVVAPGQTYALGASYHSDAPMFFTVYAQDGSGTWSYWTQSPAFEASAAYTRAEWTTPAVPAGTVALSFGATLDQVGTLTTDDYALIRQP